MKVYKVAVIGCGRIAGHNCRAIENTEGLMLAAVCDLQIEKANEYRDEFKVPAFSNYNTMLKIDDTDFDSTNPGVWTHSLHKLMDRRKFTPWTDYAKDEVIK